MSSCKSKEKSLKNSKKKINYSVWFDLLIVCLILWGGLTIFESWSDQKKKDRKEYLRESFSPMSDDPEIQEAYKTK